MKIFVKVKPQAREEKIEKIDEAHFNISVIEPPVQGRANQAVIKVLARHFQTAPQNIRIVSGLTSRQKLIEIK